MTILREPKPIQNSPSNARLGEIAGIASVAFEPSECIRDLIGRDVFS